MRVLTEADVSVVGDLCVAQSCYLRAWRKVREMNAAGESGVAGMIIKTKSDYLAENMLFTQVKNLTEIKRKLYGELGLTPAARPRIQAAPKDMRDHNPFLNLG